MSMALVGLACGGGESIPLADLDSKAKVAICDQFVRCGSFPSEAACEQAVFSKLQFQADVASGKVRYDGEAAARCLDGYETAGCNISDRAKDDALVQICDSAFQGTVPDGGACLIANDCVSHSCNTEACAGAMCCAGTCQPKLAVGSDCRMNGAVCDTGSFCRYDPATTKAACKLTVPEGQPCDVQDSCAPGTTCLVDRAVVGSTGICGKAPAEGQPCPAGICDSPLDYCDATGKTCVRRLAVGVACTAATPCVGYATCSATTGTCVALAEAGSACDANIRCLSGLSCTSGICVGHADEPACP